VDSVPVLPDDGTIILVSVSDKSLKDNRAKRVIELNKYKSYDKNGIAQWALREGNRFNLSLNDVVGALFVNCGNDLRKIRSEIRKLKVISDQNGIVDLEIAKQVLCFSTELTPKSIINAVCNGKTSHALVFYDKLQEKGNETGWIAEYVYRHVLQFIRLRLAFDAGLLVGEAVKSLGLNMGTYRNNIESYQNLWSFQSLRKSLEVLCEIDLLHKNGFSTASFYLEQEIIRLSEEARSNAKRS
jgi:DNA polymerase III delta subunit